MASYPAHEYGKKKKKKKRKTAEGGGERMERGLRGTGKKELIYLKFLYHVYPLNRFRRQLLFKFLLSSIYYFPFCDSYRLYSCYSHPIYFYSFLCYCIVFAVRTSFFFFFFNSQYSHTGSKPMARPWCEHLTAERTLRVMTGSSVIHVISSSTISS